MGDGPVFVRRRCTLDGAARREGAGQVLYEIQFNVGDFGGGNLQFFPRTHQPQAAAAYQRLW